MHGNLCHSEKEIQKRDFTVIKKESVEDNIQLPVYDKTEKKNFNQRMHSGTYV